jgi:hypothetical protein
MYRNDWFEGRHARRQLPLECICDCSGSGDRSHSVAYWVDRLEFDGPPWLFREYLREFGAWDRSDLCDHTENRRRVLWTWACASAENPGAHDYLYLGI